MPKIELRAIANDLALIELGFVNLKALLKLPPPVLGGPEYEEAFNDRLRRRTAKYSVGDPVKGKTSGMVGCVIGICKDRMGIRVLYHGSKHPKTFYPNQLVRLPKGGRKSRAVKV